jgi:hypothetical protein
VRHLLRAIASDRTQALDRFRSALPRSKIRAMMTHQAFRIGERAMCWRSASDFDLYARRAAKPVRTTSKPARSLGEVWRDLFRRRRPQMEPAEVVRFPAGGAAGTAKAGEREGAKAA